MGKLISEMCCCLCGAQHQGAKLQKGWFAEGVSAKGYKANKVLCPKCLKRAGVKINKVSAVPKPKVVQRYEQSSF